MLINMVKAVTTRSRTRNTTLIEGTEEHPPLRMDINTDNAPRTKVSKETTNNNSEDNSRDTSVNEMQSMDPFCKRIMKRLLNKTAPKQLYKETLKANCSTESPIKYKQHQNLLNRIKGKAKTSYYNTKYEEYRNNTKKL